MNIIDNIGDSNAPFELYVSLPLIQRRSQNGKKTKLDANKCKGNFYAFRSRLQTAIFAGKFAPYERQLMAVGYIEQTGRCGLHMHVALEQPKHIDEQHYRQLIREIWLETAWGDEPIRFNDMPSWLEELAPPSLAGFI